MRKDIQQQLDGKFPGVSISVEKDANGPPAGYPITIEITGKEYIELVETAKSMKDYLNQINIAGVEELKIDVSKNKPGVKINIDRKKVGELGVTTSQVGQLLRSSLLGPKLGYLKKMVRIMKLTFVLTNLIVTTIMLYLTKILFLEIQQMVK